MVTTIYEGVDISTQTIDFIECLSEQKLVQSPHNSVPSRTLLTQKYSWASLTTLHV